MGYNDLSNIHQYYCFFMQKASSRKQIEMPRGFLKTCIASIAYPIWITLPRKEADEFPIGINPKDHFYNLGPNLRILIASYVVANSMKMISLIRRTYERNTMLRLLFPEVIPDNFQKVKWSDTEACIKRDRDFTECTFEAGGIGGSTTSRHYDLIIEDDLIYACKDDFSGRELQPNQEDIDKAVGWHKLAMSLLVPGNHTKIYNVGTRWAKHDLIDFIRTNEPEYEIFQRAATVDRTFTSHSEPTWKEMYDLKKLDQIRHSQGPFLFCTPAETPIMMADLTTKKISEIKAGDEIAGFTIGNKKESSRLKKSIVKKVHSFVAPVYKIKLESGITIRCTKEHKWYTGRNDKTHKLYAPAKVGGYLAYSFDPYVEELSGSKRDTAKWIGGIFDGEGSCTGGSIFFHQSHHANPEVCLAIENALTLLGYDWNKFYSERSDIRFRTLNSYSSCYYIMGGNNEKKRFIIQSSPIKKKKIIDSVYKRSGHMVDSWDKIISIAYDKDEVVYALETETGNYIAWGYMSSNSTQYLGIPTVPEDKLFKKEWLQFYKNSSDLPKTEEMRIFTTIDLSLWSNTKRKGHESRGVILTCGWDRFNNVWILHYDAARFDPSEIIDHMYKHYRLFHPEMIGVEAVYYQKSLMHFLHKDMEKRGWLPVRELTTDSSTSKDLRIRALEPYAMNLAIHCRPEHEDFIMEFAEYTPDNNGVTKDILDALSYQLQIARPGAVQSKVRVKPIGDVVLTTGTVEEFLKHAWNKGKHEGKESFAEYRPTENPFDDDARISEMFENPYED